MDSFEMHLICAWWLKAYSLQVWQKKAILETGEELQGQHKSSDI